MELATRDNASIPVSPSALRATSTALSSFPKINQLVMYKQQIF